jgi:hypothetical protein
LYARIEEKPAANAIAAPGRFVCSTRETGHALGVDDSFRDEPQPSPHEVRADIPVR